MELLTSRQPPEPDRQSLQSFAIIVGGVFLMGAGC